MTRVFLFDPFVQASLSKCAPNTSDDRFSSLTKSNNASACKCFAPALKLNRIVSRERSGFKKARVLNGKFFASKSVSQSSPESESPVSKGETKSDNVVEFSGTDENASTSNVDSKNQVQAQEEIGRQISEARKQMVASGVEDSSSTNQFWVGVWEETKMIEWPKFSYVLGTTGVVVTMILGSSVVLLTVNAILTEASDTVFSIPAVARLWGN